MHVGVFNKFVFVDLRLHRRLFTEVVVYTVLFSRSRLAGCMAHGKSESPREIFEQHTDQCALQSVELFVGESAKERTLLDFVSR